MKQKLKDLKGISKKLKDLRKKEQSLYNNARFLLHVEEAIYPGFGIEKNYNSIIGDYYSCNSNNRFLKEYANDLASLEGYDKELIPTLYISGIASSIIDLNTQKGNFCLGFAGNIDVLSKKTKLEYNTLFGYKDGKWKRITYITPNARKIEGALFPEKISFTEDNLVLIRSIERMPNKEYEKLRGKKSKATRFVKPEDKGEWLDSTGRTTDMYHIINSNLELIKLEYEKGKQMWQNTPEYLKRVQMEEENRINNLKRKTEPSGRHREAKLLKKKQLKKERNQ